MDLNVTPVKIINKENPRKEMPTPDKWKRALAKNVGYVKTT